MKAIYLSIILIAILFSSFSPPKIGDWSCRADGITTNCSAFAWNKDRDKASKEALDLCSSGCQDECEVAVCERVE